MGIKGWLGFNKGGKSLKPEEVATEQAAQAAVDKLVTGSKQFGNRTMSAKDAETQLRAQGLLPQGWRLRESDSTSSGYRPTQAASKKAAVAHAGILAGAGISGVGLAGLGPLAAGSALSSGLGGAALQGGLGATSALAEGKGVKGALIGGGIGAATGGFAPGAGGVASKLGQQVALQGGLGAAQGLASGGGWKGALKGGAIGAGGALAPKVAPAVTKSALGQKAINLGLNTGLNTASTGRFDLKGTAINAGSTFLPDAATKLSANPTAQKWTNFAGNQALQTAATGKFDPVKAGVGAMNVAHPTESRAMNSLNQFAPAASNVYSQFMPQSQVGQSTWASPNTAATAAAPGTAPIVSNDPSQQGGGGWGQWGPIAGQVGGAVVGGIMSSKAQKEAEKRSAEEQAALRGGQGAAGTLARGGASLLEESRPYIKAPANYYNALLRGNRAAMTQAVAPGMAQVTGVYRGAERDLDRTGVRGAQRDVASSELGREKASKLASLVTGVQPYAAEQLAKLGTDVLGQANPMLSNSGNIYTNMLSQGLANRTQAAARGAEAGKAWGGLVRDIGENIPGGKNNPRKPKAGAPKPGDKVETNIPDQGGAGVPAPAPVYTPPVYSPSPSYTPPVFGPAPAPSPGTGYGGTAPVFGTPPKTTPGYTQPTFGGWS